MRPASSSIFCQIGAGIRAKWGEGPTTKEVEAVINKYQEGNFNGMEDIYEYSETGRIWTEIFGGAMYVFANRELDYRVQERANS